MSEGFEPAGRDRPCNDEDLPIAAMVHVRDVDNLTETTTVTDDGRGASDSGASRLIRRQRILLAVAVTAALVSTGGLVASTFVKSPAQLAAEHGPPSPSTLTTPVVKQVLTKTIVVRGTVTAGSTLSITPTAVQGAAALVVTRVIKHPGDQVAAGDVLVEVSGRPVIALPGATPAYRDLRPGDTGADIGELQAALNTLGYRDTDASGTVPHRV